LRKILFIIMFIFVSVFIMSSNYTFIFKDAILHYVQHDEKIFEIPDRYNVQWVIGADDWSIKENQETFSFKIIKLDDYSHYELKQIENNVLLVEELNSILFYNSKINQWCITDKSNLIKLSSKRILEVNSKKNYFVGLIGYGQWEIFYEMKNDGTFIQKIQIDGEPVGLTNAYVINRNISDSRQDLYQTRMLMEKSVSDSNFASYESEIISDTYILKLGEIDFNGKTINFTLENFRIRSFEDRYTIKPNVYIDSSKAQNVEIIRSFENSPFNGVGEPFPSGKVLIHENFNGNSFVIKQGRIDNTPVNEYAKISLGESWDVKYDFLKISDRTVRDHNTRVIQFQINVINSSSETKKMNLNISQSGLEIQNFMFDNKFKSIQNNSKLGILNFDFEINPNSTGEISITISIKY